MFFNLVLYGFSLACFFIYLISTTRLAVAEHYRRRGLAALHGTLADSRPLHVVILHPDLGIGGAERLVIDAAVGLQRHQQVAAVAVTIVTPHHDKRHAFRETVDGTVRVQVRGSWLPASVFGRAKVFCAIVRMAYVAFATCRAMPEVDCYVVDQVAAAMPVLRYLAPHTPLLFYSHFPDQRCDANRNEDGSFRTDKGRLLPGHVAYRGFFDRLEGISMMAATSIVCNSRFSRGVTIETFPGLAARIDAERDILYPPVASVEARAQGTAAASEAALPTDDEARLAALLRDKIVFVSINRYERKKNIGLAIEAFAQMRRRLQDTPIAEQLLLVVAGGYDPRLAENVSYAAELAKLANSESLALPHGLVHFMRNITDAEKELLLRTMRALVYTPASEHFGIVPVEAMRHGRPVIAVAHGGPCESVGDVTRGEDDVGGILCEANAESFADAMTRLAEDADEAERLGACGKRRAAAKFDIAPFSAALATRIVRLVAEATATVKELAREIEAQRPAHLIARPSNSTTTTATTTTKRD